MTFLDRHKKVFTILIGNLFILSVFLLVLDRYSVLVVSNHINLKILYVISWILAFSWLLVFAKTNKQEYNKISRPIIDYIFILGLILLAIRNFQFNLVQSDFFESLFYFIYSKNLTIAAITFIAGFFVFYFDSVEFNEKNTIGSVKRKVKKEKFGRNQFIEFVFKKNNFSQCIILLIICIVFFVFGSIHLGQFMSVDEPKWVDDRVPQLYHALSEKKWEETYINDKPGILPAFLSGFVNYFLNYEDFGPLNREKYLFWWRMPILVFNLILLFPIYNLSKKLLDKDSAILITGLIALNPVLIGISQIVNPDATLWSTTIISFISFFLYLKTNKNYYVWLSGVFLGTSLLSKYFASVFYLIFFVPIYLEYLSTKGSYAQLCSRLVDLMKLYAISVGIYFIFFPFNWTNPKQIYLGTFGNELLITGASVIFITLFIIFSELILLKGKFTNYLREKYNINMILFNLFGVFFFGLFIFLIANMSLNNIIFDPDSYIFYEFERREFSFFSDLFASAHTLFYTLTLPLLIGIFFFIFSPKRDQISENTIILNTIIFTVIFFHIGAALGGFFVNARYQIMLYPMFAVFASTIILAKFRTKKILTITVTLLLSVAAILSSIPFYYHYTNEFHIKGTITEAWGFGGYELAKIMNDLPNASNVTVWSDREGFNEFFIGKSYWRGRDNPFSYKEEIDYLILTRGGERIFSRALTQYEEGRKNSYATIAGEYDILSYYSGEFEFNFCIDNNPSNCVSAIRFNS